VHFFQYSPEMTSNRHHWQTSVEGLAHHDWFKAQKALNLANEKAQRCENVADKAPAQFRPHRFAKTLPPPEVTQALSTKRGKLTSQRGASRGASTNGTRVRLLLDSEGCHLLPGGLRPAVPRMRQAGAPTPGTHSGKTIGLPTGRSEWGKSPSTRRTGARVPVRRDVVNARSMPVDQSLPTGAFASAQNGRFPYRRATPDAFWRQRLAKKRRLPFEVFLTRSRYPPSSQVHTANQVARRHVRSWLCDTCQNGSAKVRRRPRR